MDATDESRPKAHNDAMTERPAEKPGLRERKKARTRASIQEHALRLFREQGYESTTVDEIAEAAEVSPSTFFRYFGSKEDVVVYDYLDPILIEAWRAQPPELGPVQAMRRAMVEVFSGLNREQLEDMNERARLIYAVPELRMAMIDDLIRTSAMLADEVAARTGRPADDLRVRTFTGALIGAIMAAILPAIARPSPDWVALIDEVFQYFENGLPL
jgi:AcrR family transcriptional regulator